MTTAATVTRAGILARVSTVSQKNEGDSIPNQLNAGRQHAAAKGYAVVKEWEEAFSGTKLKRPVLTKVLEAIADGEIDVLIVWKLDRLAREPKYQGHILTLCELAGVRVESVTEKLDDSEEGEISLFLNGLMSRKELKTKKERTEPGRRARAEVHGRILAGPAKYGYEWADPFPTAENPKAHTKRKINETEAPIAQRIFRELAGGGSVNAIINRFEAEGIKTPRGKDRWHVKTITTIVRDPSYKGEAYAYRYKNHCHGETRPESEWIPLPAGTIPALVTPEVWEKANRRLDENRTANTPKNRFPERFLLRAGIAVCGCGKCGGKPLACVNQKNGQSRYRTTNQNQKKYGCPAFSVSPTVLDPLAWSYVLDVVAHPDYVKAQTEKQAEPGTTDEDLKRIDKALVKLAAKAKNTAEAISEESTKAGRAVLLAQLEDITGQQEVFQAERRAVMELRNQSERAKALIATIQDKWAQRWEEIQNYTYQERRDVLHELGVKVKVLPGAYRQPNFTVDMDFDVAGLFGLDPVTGQSLTDWDEQLWTPADENWLGQAENRGENVPT